MGTPAYLKAFRDSIQTRPSIAHIDGMEQEFYLGSDRSAVILQAASVEMSLETLIISKMRRDFPEDLRGRLFEGNGPLSTFSSKILIGYALDLYGPVFRHDLDIIKELRNGFAHVRLPMQLVDPAIAGMCTHLQIPDNKQLNWLPITYSEKYDIEVVRNHSHPRTRFTRACHTISLCLMELREFFLGSSYGVHRTLP